MTTQISFGNAYQLLVKDFLRILEFIAPCDDNLATYSHRLYELLLRTATEFENFCKYSLQERSLLPSGRSPNINDYKQLESSWGIEQIEVGLLFWQPKKYIKPFDGWSTNAPPLAWYKAYNEVKHNRELKFSCASLENVTLAIAGLFLALSTEFRNSHSFFNPYETMSSQKGIGHPEYSETFINNSIFSIRKPKLVV
jgi:hypothetical protein